MASAEYNETHSWTDLPGCKFGIRAVIYCPLNKTMYRHMQKKIVAGVFLSTHANLTEVK